MRDLAVAPELGLERSPVFVAAVLASLSAIPLPGIPLRPGIHRKVVRPGRALIAGGESLASCSQ